MTNETKHTPGPWKQHGTDVSDGRGGFIATTIDRLTDHHGNYANARLIAAAPALLEALQRMMDENAFGRIASGETISHARVAIAQAEGRVG